MLPHIPVMPQILWWADVAAATIAWIAYVWCHASLKDLEFYHLPASINLVSPHTSDLLKAARRRMGMALALAQSLSAIAAFPMTFLVFYLVVGIIAPATPLFSFGMWATLLSAAMTVIMVLFFVGQYRRKRA